MILHFADFVLSFEKRILTHEMWESASNGIVRGSLGVVLLLLPALEDVLFCGKDKKWMHYSLLFVLIFKFAMKQ